MRWFVALAILALGAAPVCAAGEIKIGVLNDQNGPQADFAGPGSVVAAQMAIEDFGGKVGDKPVVAVIGDHQNKADIGSNLARQWFDQDGVQVIVDVPNSAVALAVADIAKTKNKLVIVSGAGTSDLTGKNCSPNTIHWTYDTWAQANIVGTAVTKADNPTWFFMTVDYAFGYALERDATQAIERAGGKVVGTIRHPLGTADFSSYLLQAQTSRAKVIGLGSAGADTINAIKQAHEFNIVEQGQALAAMLMTLNDIRSVGLESAQGIYLSEAFYWDLNDATRAWATRFAARNGGKYPNMVHAGVYSAITHYLKALAAGASPDDGAGVAAKMRAIEAEDALFGKSEVRADGRVIHDMHLFLVKKPFESKGPYDYYRLISTVPAKDAFRPLGEGGCPLGK